MKLTNILWVLALAGSVSACNSGSIVQGCDTGLGIDKGSGQCTACDVDEIVNSSWECAKCGPSEGIVGPRDCAPCADNECVNARGRCETGAAVGPQGQCEDNGGGTGGTGGTAGTGGTGGSVGGACTDPANAMVYANLTYVDDAGTTFTGTEAAAAMGSDCIFGTSNSDPLLPGCGDEARSVVACFPSCDDGTIQTLSDCVAQCVQDGTAEASPPGLSDECVACTGATVACGAAFCTGVCVADTNAPACIDCRCLNGCTPDFDECTGLPSSGDCD